MIDKHIAYIAFGANLGNPARQIEAAIEKLSSCVTILKKSTLIFTKALVLEGQDASQIPDYANAVVQIETTLAPLDLLDLLLSLEGLLGRTRRTKWESRLIDMDLIAYDQLVLTSPRLVLPHDQMRQRRFVLEPLAEIAPDWIDPLSGKSVLQLLAELLAK